MLYAFYPMLTVNLPQASPEIIAEVCIFSMESSPHIHYTLPPLNKVYLFSTSLLGFVLLSAPSTRFCVTCSSPPPDASFQRLHQ